MKLIRILALAGVFAAGLLVPASPASAARQGVTVWACTASCTANGVITSTEPVPYVYPFALFECADGRKYGWVSAEVRTRSVAPVVAGVYTYEWSWTVRPGVSCAGVAWLDVFFASDNFMTDTRVAPFDSRL